MSAAAEKKILDLARKSGGVIRPRDLQRQLGQVHHDTRNLGALLDEAPAAYRDIRAVMRAQQELTRQIACLTPLLNFKYPDPRK